MVCTFNKAAPSGYYLRSLDYYATSGAGVWFSPHGQLGVADGTEVNAADFERLNAGQSLEGATLANSGGHLFDRVAAFDFTFSADKSTSLFWSCAPASLAARIVAEHLAAVRDGLQVIETLAGATRHGKGGARLRPAALTAALFTHTDSRPSEHVDGVVFADMNLHVHAAVANLVACGDGKLRALHSTLLRRAKMAAGAAYHASHAHRLSQLGVQVEAVGKNGQFQISGIAPELITYFSGRRREIEQELAAAGVTSDAAPALAGLVARTTRSTKGKKTTEEERRGDWKAAFARLCVRQADVVVDALANWQDVAKLDGEAVYRERLANIATHLTHSDAVFDQFTLHAAFYSELVGTGLPIARAHEALADLPALGIVEIGTDALDLPMFSTVEMIRTELEVVELARQLQAKTGFACDRAAALAACKDFGLSGEQTDAALAAMGPAAIALVEGAPGSGKSTSLRPVVQQYQAGGYRVIAAATAWKIARGLGADLSIDSHAIAALIAKINQGERVLDSHTVLVVDEFGLLSAADTRTLLAAVSAAGAKLIVVGDREQLKPIGAGSGLELISRSVDAYRIDTIVRQHHAWSRQMVRDFGAGRAADALHALDDHGDLRFAKNANGVVADIVDHWRERMNAGVEPLILARSNAQVRQLSLALRENCRSAGTLSEDIVAFVGRAGDRSFDMTLAVGDKIRFNLKNANLGVVNGSTGRIIAIEQADNWLDTKVSVDIDGRQQRFTLSEFADEAERVALSWAYASTIFSSQGLTVDEAIVFADAGYDRNAAYVATSRARERTTLFTDASSLIALEQHETGPEETLLKRLTETLAQRWARNPKKSSTLDYIDPADWRHLLGPGFQADLSSEPGAPDDSTPRMEPDYV